MKKIGIRKKMIGFVAAIAAITYAISGLCFYIVRPAFFPNLNEELFLIGTSMIVIVLAAVLASLFSTVLFRPLEQLKQTAVLVTEGKFKAPDEIPASSEEFRSVATAFQLLSKNVKSVSDRAEISFGRTTQVAERLSESAVTASDGADAIAMATAQISIGLQHSAAAIYETSEAVETIRKLSVEINSQAHQSIRQSGEITEELTAATHMIQSLIAGIQQMADNSETALTHVRELKEDASQIEEISQLVGAIAEQTNLLALNASIEAARAGEQGRGFAVVAEEVRKLADQSGNAVKAISGRISTIQGSVQNVAAQMENQVTFASTEEQKVTDATAAVLRMEDKIRLIVQSVEEIAALITKQLLSIDSTAHQSQKVAAIAQETSASAEEVQSATDEQMKALTRIIELTADMQTQANELYTVITRTA